MNIDEGIILIRTHASAGESMNGFMQLVISITMLALSSFIFYIFNTWNKPLQQKGRKKTIMGNITLIMVAILSFFLANFAYICLVKWITDNRYTFAVAAFIFLFLFVIVNHYLYSYTKKRSCSFSEVTKEQ